MVVLFVADIEKAFDSVEHSFIFGSLKRFGFGDEFIQWIRTFLYNACSCVTNNGVSLQVIFLLSEVQGKVIPYQHIFLFCVLKCFFFQIRSGSSIKGFKFNSIEIQLTAFADDTTFLVEDVQCLRNSKFVKVFRSFSSLKFNVEKCEAWWIGSSRNKHTKPIQCKWISLTQISMKS